tara:strand:+ start:59 stop:715 length:657 start_codon:yes stop_codon:yes gene_type:complete
MKKIKFYILILFSTFSFAQVYSFKNEKNGKIIIHRITIDKEYIVETQFVSDPAEFILTRGGFYTKDSNKYKIALEFNSNYENDSLKELELIHNKLWNKSSKIPIDLDGKWLMAGRITDKGERRRDVSKPRKTMKFLKNGYFQWIAFNTETFQFFGSGGGLYNAENKTYTENIEFFSRNNKSVGRILPFQYSIDGNDWHHQGRSSKGNPMHEIWTRRNP